jgi:hypothetical protein
MAPITAGVLLAHVRDRSFGVSALDFERSYQRIPGFDRHLIRLASDLDSDSIPDAHACSLHDPSKNWRLDPGMPTLCALAATSMPRGSLRNWMSMDDGSSLAPAADAVAQWSEKWRDKALHHLSGAWARFQKASPFWG